MCWGCFVPVYLHEELTDSRITYITTISGILDQAMPKGADCILLRDPRWVLKNTLNRLTSEKIKKEQNLLLKGSLAVGSPWARGKSQWYPYKASLCFLPC